MKKTFTTIILGLCFLYTKSQINFAALTLGNSFPQVNQTLSFQYNQNISTLIKEKTIEIVVYQFTDKGLIVKEPIATKKGSIYYASIMIDTNATCLAFVFSGKENIDNNSGAGYIVPIYTKSKEPVKGYYASAAEIYLGQGESLFGMQNNHQKGLELTEKSILKHPELENESSYYNNYFDAIKRVKQYEAEKIISKIIINLESKIDLSEDVYLYLYFYLGENDKLKSDSIRNIILKKFPNNTSIKESDFVNNFLKEKSADKKEIIYKEYRAFNSNKEWEGSPLGMMKKQIALAYVREKNNTMFEKWLKELPKSEKAALLNNKAWALADAGEKLLEAKKLSRLAIDYAKEEYQNPIEKKSSSETSKEWKQKKETNYTDYTDTYAYILYKLGQYREGLAYAKIIVSINKFSNIEYNERYAMLLEKAAPAVTAKKIIEKIVEKSAASEKTIGILKRLYIKIKKTDKGFKEYFNKLEVITKESKKKDLFKLLINIPSPNFALKDWEGKEVTLESLKGKIVVLDFWATWCGPCIASMPGMKLAQEKYAIRDDIKFIFVDTWERGEKKNEEAKEIINKNSYPFYVLMDNENKAVRDFAVRGIPTKFIIDKSGNIRFKFVGYSGSPQNVLDEITSMIEILEKLSDNTN